MLVVEPVTVAQSAVSQNQAISRVRRVLLSDVEEERVGPAVAIAAVTAITAITAIAATAITSG